MVDWQNFYNPVTSVPIWSDFNYNELFMSVQPVHVAFYK